MIAELNRSASHHLTQFVPLDRSTGMRIDLLLAVLIGLVISVGIVMSASSSIGLTSAVGDNLYYLKRHLIYLALGCSVGWVILRIPVSYWYRMAPLLLLSAVVLLVLVLIPGIGVEVNGARRWIRMGILNFQISEFAKLAFILFLAGYLVRRGDELRSRTFGFIKPVIILGCVIGLIVLEPDFGSVVVITGVAFGMMFLAGIPLAILLLMGALAVGLLGLLIVLEPYRMQRVLTYLDPWSDQFNSGYQLTQSLMAFGRGEWLGVGLGNSVQKLSYLPEAHTDFVFAILAEETGLIGAAAVLVLLAMLIFRVMKVGFKACQRGELFGGYVCMGVAVLFACQVFINIGVASGLLPTKGLTLPLISYGGSSLLICLVMLSIVVRVAHENQLALEHDQRIQEGSEQSREESVRTARGRLTRRKGEVE